MKQRNLPARLRETIPKIAPDVLMLLGATAIVKGVGMIFLPAAWLAAGILLIVGAVIWSKGGGDG